MKVEFSYLRKQFANPKPILKDVEKLVKSGDFTLGKAVGRFEEKFAKICGTRYAVGVNSGTDALFLSLKALGVGPGDEVITMTSTFIATAGAIAAAGARPVFVDCNEEYVIDPEKMEAAVTPRTKALMPVHYAGHPADMPRVLEIARRRGIPVIEDACQGIGSSIDGKVCGSFGVSAGFSLHPLKNINVWSDGGVVTTNSEETYRKLLLLRNHGMKDRDTYEFFGYNSRLDTVQAVVGLRVIKDFERITRKKIEHAGLYDEAFKDVPEIALPPRRKGVRYVYHLYIIQARDRDGLLKHLQGKGIEAKVHYPVPLHLQPCSRHLGYKAGDFPVAEAQAKSIITLPGHQHLTRSQIGYVIDQVRKFYGKR